MRGIKFRGKSTLSENWFTGSLIFNFNGNEKYFIHSFIFGMVEVEAETIAQFTGIQDANGQDIYEGDIIQYGDVYLAKVVFHEDSASFGFVDLKDNPIMDNMRWFENDIEAQECEAIGNIHQNPELL